MPLQRILAALVFASCTSNAVAQNAQTYLYDAQGRLVAATTARTVGDGAISRYGLDDANNRTERTAIAVTPPPTGDTLGVPYGLVPSQKLTSANGLYTLTLETSGDFVIRNNSGAVIWNSCTGTGRSTLAMVNPNGLLGIYDTSLNLIWSAGTSANPGAYLVLGSNGVARLETSGGALVWSSVTPCV